MYLHTLMPIVWWPSPHEYFPSKINVRHTTFALSKEINKVTIVHTFPLHVASMMMVKRVNMW